MRVSSFPLVEVNLWIGTILRVVELLSHTGSKFLCTCFSYLESFNNFVDVFDVIGVSVVWNEAIVTSHHF